MTKHSLLLILFAALFSGSTFLGRGTEIKVFAAASLTDVLKEIAKGYEAQSGDKIVFNFEGSNVLARQIGQGAPADLFFSADEKQMDVIAAAGLLKEGSRRDILSNQLVIVVPTASPKTALQPRELASPEIKRIALADPQTVPAGVYAKAYLQKIGVWDSVQAKIVPTQNVRAALAAVSSDNVEAGIVYKTDALISKGVKIANEIPLADGPRISYPLAELKSAASSAATDKFLAYLESSAAQAIFVKYGFIAGAK